MLSAACATLENQYTPGLKMTVFLSVVFNPVTFPGPTTREVCEAGSGTISGAGKGLAKISRELRGSLPTIGFPLSKGPFQYDSPEGLVFCTRPPTHFSELKSLLGQCNILNCETSLDGMIDQNGALRLDIVFNEGNQSKCCLPTVQEIAQLLWNS